MLDVVMVSLENHDFRFRHFLIANIESTSDPSALIDETTGRVSLWERHLYGYTYLTFPQCDSYPVTEVESRKRVIHFIGY